MERMKTQTIGLTVAFCFLAGGLCFAADLQMGTWKLNEAKSKATPGMGKVTMVTYKNTLGNVKVAVDGVDAKGKTTITGQIEVAADGKSRTVTTTGVDSNGKKVKSRSVYDKQ